MIKKQKTRALGSKINDQTAEWYETTFPSLNGGVTMMLEALPHIYAHTLVEMRGSFSIGELSMILEVLNGHGAVLASGPPSLAGVHIVLSIVDSFALYPGQYEEKWNVAQDVMLPKLRSLTRFQLLCLEIWAARFWNGDYNAENAVENHCATLL